MLASPFVDNLERCIVYIDEAHTRGIDLKLLVYAKVAVTLGLGQTKDQTVQGKLRHEVVKHDTDHNSRHGTEAT